MKYKDKPVYKIQYIIMENETNKVLMITTKEVDRRDISGIGEYALLLNRTFCNTYVLIKVY